jgi:hypothetical protein
MRVVAHHARGIVLVGRAVVENDRHPGAAAFAGQQRREADRQEHQGIDAIVQHVLDRWFALRGKQHQPQAVLVQPVRKQLQRRDEERIGQLPTHANDARPATDQRTRQRVGAIAQLGGRRENALPLVCHQAGAGRERARHRRLRHARLARDIMHGNRCGIIDRGSAGIARGNHRRFLSPARAAVKRGSEAMACLMDRNLEYIFIHKIEVCRR